MLVKCERCRTEKTVKHYRPHEGQPTVLNCLKCRVAVNARMDWIRAMGIQRVFINLPSKDSEYHKNLERTDTNPKFFNWLCSGSKLEFN